MYITHLADIDTGDSDNHSTQSCDELPQSNSTSHIHDNHNLEESIDPLAEKCYVYVSVLYLVEGPASFVGTKTSRFGLQVHFPVDYFKPGADYNFAYSANGCAF